LTNCVSVPLKTLAAAGTPMNLHLNTVPDDPPQRYLVRSISTSLCISDGRWPRASLSVDLCVFSKWLARPSMWWRAFRNLEKNEGLCAFTWCIMHSLSSLNSSSTSVCEFQGQVTNQNWDCKAGGSPTRENREMVYPLEADGYFYPGKFSPNLKKRYAIWCLYQKHCSREIAVNGQRMCMKNNT
jgi:hypothetical protein